MNKSLLVFDGYKSTFVDGDVAIMVTDEGGMDQTTLINRSRRFICRDFEIVKVENSEISYPTPKDILFVSSKVSEGIQAFIFCSNFERESLSCLYSTVPSSMCPHVHNAYMIKNHFYGTKALDEIKTIIKKSWIDNRHIMSPMEYNSSFMTFFKDILIAK